MKTQGQTQPKWPTVAGKTMSNHKNNMIRNLKRHPKL